MKSLYTKKLGSSVADDARPSNPASYHVILGDADRWAVVPKGSTKAMKVFPTRGRAIAFAKQNAAKKSGTVIIHNRTGQVRDLISFRE